MWEGYIGDDMRHEMLRWLSWRPGALRQLDSLRRRTAEMLGSMYEEIGTDMQWLEEYKVEMRYLFVIPSLPEEEDCWM